MSFSSELRAELARLNPSGRQAGETELAVLLQNLCRFTRMPDGKTELRFLSGNECAVKKCFTLIQKNVKISSDLYAFRQPEETDPAEGGRTDAEDMETGGKKEARTGKQDVFLLPRQFTELLQKLGLLSAEDGTIPSALTEGKRSREYLRAMFLCTGFMSDPAQRYHLEFRCSSQPLADQLRGVLAGASIHAGLTRRKSYYVVYLKDSEEIVTVLHLMGASVSLMATENARIYKEVRNNVNRRVNCEAANIGKTVESARRQREDIRLLHERGILNTLPAPLHEAAMLREQNPEASLSELGRLADPPVGRSGMNHRMRKLSSLADKVRSDDAAGQDKG